MKGSLRRGAANVTTVFDDRVKIISGYKGYRYDKGVKAATINRELTIMKHMYTMAIREWEWCRDNPVKRVRMEKEGPPRDRWLTFEDEKRLLEACPDWLKEIVTFALSTGMREQEIISLKWKQINTVNNQINLPDTKSGKPEIIRLNKTALEALNGIKRKGEFVFYTQHGKRLKSIRRSWYTLLNIAKITDFRFHDLRHTFASYLAMQGANQFDLQDALRHSSLDMTQRYVHLMPSHKDKVSGLLDDFLDAHENRKEKKNGENCEN